MDLKLQNAIISYSSGYFLNSVNSYQVKNLLDLCEHDPQKILEALRVYVDQTAKMKTLFLSIYFLQKYGDRDQGKTAANKTGLLSKAMNFFFRKAEGGTGTHFRIQKEDESLLKELEEAALQCQKEMTMYLRNAFLVPLAYINGDISDTLRDLVTDSFQKNPVETIKAIGYSTNGFPGKVDFNKYGYDFAERFRVDPESLLHACGDAEELYPQENLGALYLRYPDIYRKVMKKMDVIHYNIMLSSARMADPAFEDTDRMMPKLQDKEQAIRLALASYHGLGKPQVQDYLLGKSPVEVVYPYVVQGIFNSSGHEFRNAIGQYLISYKDDEMERKMYILMILLFDIALIGSEFNYRHFMEPEALLENLLSVLEKEDVAYQYRLNFLADLIEESVPIYVECYAAAEKLLKKDRNRAVEEFAKSHANGRMAALYTYQQHAEHYKDAIFSFVTDGAKSVREEVITILGDHPEWEDDVKKLAESKKSAVREIAIKVLQIYETDGKSYQELFTTMLEKEKNAKLRTLLESTLPEGASAEAPKKAEEDPVQAIHKGGKKRHLSWLYQEAHFEPVHHKDGKPASEEYLQAICLYYAAMERCGVNLTAKGLAEDLNQQEFEQYACAVFDLWLKDGAQAKRKWVLYFSSIHGGIHMVDKMKHYITEWAQNSRGAIAAEAVQALALNPTSQALLLVDNISRKFKFRQVKAAAGQAMVFAASELGLTVEELSDRLVPDLGFSDQMERIFDYGTRSFTAAVTPALEIEITDENGRKLKSMPAPGKKDDPEKAQASYEAFKQLKKDMKAVVANQKMRLDMALSSERLWKTEDWERLFVKNPIMHQFAIGLIWGLYEDHKLVQTFRYMEDGSFNTEEEEELELPESGTIGLVHPIELSEESLAAWKEQLDDYEIVQPVQQLERPVFYMTEEEKNSDTHALERYREHKINGLTLAGKMMGMYWYRGPVLDGGAYYEYYRTDNGIGLGVSLQFSGSFVGDMDADDVEIHEVWFYRTEQVERKGYYDEVTEKNTLALKDVPERYFSEIMLQLLFLDKKREEE